MAEGTLTNIERLAKAISGAERRLEDLRGELHEEIRAAHARGESVSLIAKVAGISRQRVHQILSEQR